MKEKVLEEQIKKYLKEQGYAFYKHAASAAMPRGIPDIICCANGRFVGIEVKAAWGKQSLAQEKWQEKIEKNGGLYILAYSLEDVTSILEGGE